MKKTWSSPKIVQLNVSETANGNNNKKPSNREVSSGRNKEKIASHVS